MKSREMVDQTGVLNGNPDLVATVLDATSPNFTVLAILLGVGDGTFRYVGYQLIKQHYPVSVLADFDTDGNLDIAVASGIYLGSIEVFAGNGDGSLTSVGLHHNQATAVL